MDVLSWAGHRYQWKAIFTPARAASARPLSILTNARPDTARPQFIFTCARNTRMLGTGGVC